MADTSLAVRYTQLSSGLPDYVRISTYLPSHLPTYLDKHLDLLVKLKAETY